MTETHTNGAAPPTPAKVELPPDRQKAIEYGLTQMQHIGHERDELRKENADLRDRIAELTIENEGLRKHESQLNDYARTAMDLRDQAMAERVKWEALFVSIQAQLRAFAVPSQPLITDSENG